MKKKTVVRKISWKDYVTVLWILEHQKEYIEGEVVDLSMFPQETLDKVEKRCLYVSDEENELIKNYLELFLINLLRSQTETKEGNKIFLPRKELSSKPVNDVIHVLEGALYSTLTIEDICAKTAYGRAYLFRVFKEKTGKTIMEYYLKLKIERAKQLLRENELSVKEISELLAFNEPNYFTKTFKRIAGLTPTTYKKRCIGLNL